MKTLKLLGALALVTFFNMTTAFGASAPMKTPADLIGTWELESFVIIEKDGHQTPWCEGLSGLLTYTQFGYMSASINCSKPSDKSPAHAYNNMLFYAGNYTVAEGPVVTHHVMNSSVKDLIGTGLIRRVAKLDKDHLTLTGDFGGNFSIVWKKAPVIAQAK